MLLRCRSLLIIFIISVISGFGKPALSVNLETTESDSVKVGLVLSGGGALGIAHLGILQAIEEAGIRIDYITGTSMGSMVGGLYSIGYTSDQLIEIAQSNNFTELFTERSNRRHITNYEKNFDSRTIASFPITSGRIDLPLGIITGQNVYSFLTKLTWTAQGTENFDDFPIPFAAIGTELQTGQAKVFRSGYLPDAIRASISIPSLFSPHEIDGVKYIDGGMIRNIPVQDAIDMGATYTIAVDASSPLMPEDSLNSLDKILNQTVLFRVQDNAQEQLKLADYVISIDELNSYTAADFDLAELFIEIGKREGEKHLDKFREIAAKQSSPPPPRYGVGEPGSLPVSNVIINGNEIYGDEFILQSLEFEPGMSLSPDLMEEKISKLQSSQFINQVTYRILPSDDYYYDLHINVIENRTDEFKVGLRYETGSQASILAESTFRNLLHSGSINRFEARLGERVHFLTDYLYYGALGSRFASLTSIQYLSENVDWFVEGERVSRFENQVIRGESSVGNYFSVNNLIAIGLRKDFTFHTNRINPDDIGPTDRDYHALFARYIRDSLNRKSYPTSGRNFIVDSYFSDSILLSPINFFSTSFYYKGYYEITNNFSLKNSLMGGYTVGDDLPWDYWFSLNRLDLLHGFIRFASTERHEISARNIQMASVGFQAEPFYHRFIGIDAYAGRFLDEWNLRLSNDDIEYGFSLTAGALTILGPIKAIFSTSTLSKFRAELQVGFQF